MDLASGQRWQVGEYVAKADKFRFRRLDTIGAAAAEEDKGFLQECFVATSHLHLLQDCKDPRSIVLGRTGSGKTALLHRLAEIEPRTIEIRPESLALAYISNSDHPHVCDRTGGKVRHLFSFALEACLHR